MLPWQETGASQTHQHHPSVERGASQTHRQAPSLLGLWSTFCGWLTDSDVSGMW